VSKSLKVENYESENYMKIMTKIAFVSENFRKIGQE